MAQNNLAVSAQIATTLRLLVTIAEAAAALGISRSALYELVLAGEIPSVKIGRARRIPVKSLEEFVAHRLNEHEPQEVRYGPARA